MRSEAVSACLGSSGCDLGQSGWGVAVSRRKGPWWGYDRNTSPGQKGGGRPAQPRDWEARPGPGVAVITCQPLG